MIKKQKILNLLSKVTIGSIIAMIFPIYAYATLDGILTKSSNNEYYFYNYDKLIKASEDNAIGLKSKLFNDYMNNIIVAIHDDKKGYIDYKKIEEAAEDSVIKDEYFDLDDFIKSAEVLKDLPKNILDVSEDLDGKIVKKPYVQKSLNRYNNVFEGFEKENSFYEKPYIYYLRGNDIIRINENGTSKEILNTSKVELNGECQMMGVNNEDVYFMKRNENRDSLILKFNTKNNKFEKILLESEGYSAYPIIYEGYIYYDKVIYMNDDNMKFKLCRCKLDGTDKKEICENAQDIVFTNKYIVVKSEDNEESLINVFDKKTLKKVRVIKKDFMQQLDTDGENLYYETGTAWVIGKINLDNGETTYIDNEGLSYMNFYKIYNGNLYFTLDIGFPCDARYLYSMSLNDNKVKRVCDLSGNEYGIYNYKILGNYIYFGNKRVKLDGSEKEILWNE